jgi:hypothetical protein
MVVGIMNINEKTNIPLFSAIGGIIVLLGFSFWLTSLYSIAVEAQRVNEKQDAKLELLYEIKTDVAVIKKILENKR